MSSDILPTLLAMQGVSPAPTSSPDVTVQARSLFPILNNPDIYYRYTPRSGSDVPYLEAFPPGEHGNAKEPRPKQFPLNKYGIEVYKSSTRPLDVLGDVVSHFLRNTDPTIKTYYSNFEKSLTLQQKQRLQEQYRWAQQHEGEKRPFQQWYETSGLPAYFRGYAFQQWPNAQHYYTPDQIKMFDSMMQYLRGSK